MADKTNIDWYCECLTVIEDEFGAKWLAERVKRQNRGTHPIPHLWAKARAMLASAKSHGRLETSFELAGLFDLATDLETARKLTGYADAVTPKRLKSLEYDKDCYVAYVAALGVRNGYEVEFVPTSTKVVPRSWTVFRDS